MPPARPWSRLSLAAPGATLRHPGAGNARSCRRTRVLSHSDPTTGLPTAARAARPGAAETGADAVLARVLTSLDDDKAEDVVQIDLRGRSDVADWMVIASGRSTRQVSAIAEKLMDRLKTDLGILARVEGKEAADWVLIDAGDVIVHVFRPEVRGFYQLEKMWMPAAQQAARVAPV